MAERFSLVNRGYDAVKVGPSTTNRLLKPPRRVGEITPTTNLRDEKNAKGPLAKVKLTPETQFGDNEGRDKGMSTAQQTANEYSGGDISRGEFDTDPPSDFEKGLVAVGKTALGAAFAPIGIAMAIDDFQKQNPLSLGGRLSIVTQGSRREKSLQEYRARRDKATVEKFRAETKKNDRLKEDWNITRTRPSTGKDKQPIRTAKNKKQENQLGGGNDYGSALAEDSPDFGVF